MEKLFVYSLVSDETGSATVNNSATEDGIFPKVMYYVREKPSQLNS